MAGDIHILARRLLSRGYGVLERFTYTRKRADGSIQKADHEMYDSGNGAAILLYDPSRSRIVLVRQFRLTAFVKDGRKSLIEVCAGKLDGEDAESRIIKEAEEETGFAVRNPRRLFEAYVSPGVFTEKLTFFAASYSAEDRIGQGGGLADEGEDIEVLEPTLDEALAMIHTGEIIDAKTILLLYYAKQTGLMRGEDTPSSAPALAR